MSVSTYNYRNNQFQSSGTTTNGYRYWDGAVQASIQYQPTLAEGTTLTLPAGVIRSTYNAGTLTPYDPSDAIGDVSPTTPQPTNAKPKKNSCGTLGVILLVVIAVAVTVGIVVATAGVGCPVGHF